MPREGGASSTPRRIGSITAASGILGHPPSRVTTSEYASAFSRHVLPEVCIFVGPLRESEGAGKTGCTLHPRSRVQLRKQKCTRAYRFSGNTPAFPAQWLYGLFVLSPVNGSFATVAPAKLDFAKLDASTATSGPHDFAVRFMRARLRALRVHRIPPRVRDDREPPLVTGETRGIRSADLPDGASRIFLREGMDRLTELDVEEICPSGSLYLGFKRSRESGQPAR